MMFHRSIVSVRSVSEKPNMPAIFWMWLMLCGITSHCMPIRMMTHVLFKSQFCFKMALATAVGNFLDIEYGR